MQICQPETNFVYMSIFNSVIEKINEYIRVRGEKLKLDIITHVSRILAHFVAFLTIAVIGLFFLIFISIALGTYLNYILDSYFLGYLIVSGIYLLALIAIILLLKSKKLQNWLETLFINLSENTED